MMPILVKNDDVRSGRGAQGLSQAVTGGTGVNGLNGMGAWMTMHRGSRLGCRDCQLGDHFIVSGPVDHN